MKKLLTLLVTVAGMLGGLSSFAAPSAGAQKAGIKEMMRKMVQRPGYFFLFGQHDEKVLEFNTDHHLQICVDQRIHKIPLLVKYDGETTKVFPGGCLLVEAKKITMRAGANLEHTEDDLSGTVLVLP
jgi:hypothetical protein